MPHLAMCEESFNKILVSGSRCLPKFNQFCLMFCDLGLPTFNTVLHNAQVRLGGSVDIHNNELVKHVFHIW